MVACGSEVRRLNWDAIGAIGEVIGGVAVLITLLYLAVQVRGTNRLLLMQHRETNRAVQYDLDRYEIENREFGELLLQAETDFKSLDEVDERRVRKHIRNEIIHWQNMYVRGTLLEDPRAKWVGVNGARRLALHYCFVSELLGSGGWDEPFVKAVKEAMEADA